MNEKLTWQDNWLLGIDALDDEHREMVRLINRLVDDDERVSIQQRVSDLMEHLHKHFHREEAFLRQINYPGYSNHQREHKMEIAEITALLHELESEKRTAITPAFFQNLKYWFLNHAVLEDKRFSDFYFREYKGDLVENMPLAQERSGNQPNDT